MKLFKIFLLKFLLVIILFLSFSDIFAQTTKEKPLEFPTTGLPNEVELVDTNFIFISPHPLIMDENSTFAKKNIGGFTLLFSSSGIGLGMIYERIFNNNFKFNTDLFFSAVKNTDELEYWDYYFNDIRIYNKVNRLYIFPLSFGLQRYINIGNMTKSFRPYFGVLMGPSLIWRMPYENDWFSDVKYSKAYYRFGGGVQIGADFGDINTSLISFKMRYTFIPYSNEGIESIRNMPIKDFGGLYLSLIIGNLF